MTNASPLYVKSSVDYVVSNNFKLWKTYDFTRNINKVLLKGHSINENDRGVTEVSAEL